MLRDLIVFSDCKHSLCTYGGASYKEFIEYEGARYMLKFGETAKVQNSDQTSYINSPLTEHLASRSFEALGLPAQETLLGTYKGRSVVACKDFIYALGEQSHELIEFKILERSFVGSSSKVFKTPSYESICGVFDQQPDLQHISARAENLYWKMFLCDALFGNFDRHANNWGYILDKRLGEIISPAPVYDCAGCFTPRLNEQAMARILSDPEEFTQRALTFPKACILVKGKRPSYNDFFNMPEAYRCLHVAKDFIPTIDLSRVEEIVNTSPGMSDLQREYRCKMVESRFNTILAPAAEQAMTLDFNKLNLSTKITASHRKSNPVDRMRNLLSGTQIQDSTMRFSDRTVSPRNQLH